MTASRRRFVGFIVSLLAVGGLAISPAAAQTLWLCNGLPATMVGTPNNDVLVGTSGKDVIFAREGNDTIRSLAGDDVVCAGKGNDVVFGGGGFDIIFGAQGDDWLYAANGASPAERADTRGARMFGGAGNDHLIGSTRWDRMQGGLGIDELYGYEGQDWIRAGGGNDFVDGGPATDDLHGGNGNDTIQLTSGDDVRGGAGLDLCRLGAGTANLFRSCGLNVRESRVVAVPQPGPNGAFYMQNYPGGEVAQWIGAKPVEAEAELSRWIPTVCAAVAAATSTEGFIRSLDNDVIAIQITVGTALSSSDQNGLIAFGIVQGGCAGAFFALPDEPPAPDPATSFRGGTYIVGQEVPLGFYRTTRYWALKDSAQDIIENEFEPDGPTIAIVDNRGAFIEFGERATLITDETTALDPFSYTSGTFLVGLDVMPGTYRASPPPGDDSAYLAAMTADGSIIDNDFAFGSVIVNVPPNATFMKFRGTLERLN
jgi:Ca2+-binding RTX toxin-like protein